MAENRVMRAWFARKFKPDLSGFNPDNNIYYEYIACHFFKEYFSRHAVRSKRVLDVGCGPGFYSRLFVERGASVVGVDLSPYLIGIAKKMLPVKWKPSVEFVRGDLVDVLPEFEAESFDVIFASDAVVTFFYGRQFRKKTARPVFEEFRRLLKSEGKLLIFETHPCFKDGFVSAGNVAIPEYMGLTTAPPYHYVKPTPYKRKYARGSYRSITLSELSAELSGASLAITRIYEPEPSPELKTKCPDFFASTMRYPHMIAYEVVKIPR